MRRLALAALAAACACSHAIKDVKDCDQVQGEKRIACGVCLVQNKADGWLGTYEYRPDAPDGKRCVRLE